MEEKKCTRCGEIKPLTDFYKHMGHKDKHTTFCKTCILDRCHKNGRTISLKNSQRITKLRNSIINLLGGECKICGFTDIRALQIDHINGGGLKEIRKFKGNSIMYKYYFKNPDIMKSKLQILCANHNIIKAHENNEYRRKYI